MTGADFKVQWQWEHEGYWRTSHSEQGAFLNSKRERASGKRRSRIVSTSSISFADGSELVMTLHTPWVEKTLTDPVEEKQPSVADKDKAANDYLLNSWAGEEQ